VTDDFPEVGLEFELRFTKRALDDLGIRGLVGRGDVSSIQQASPKGYLVAKFVEQRRKVPTGTDAPLRDVGGPDIYSLHGRDGVRACTWFDDANKVCWFLGCVDEHDYAEFETRAANNELLLDEEDLTILIHERGHFDQAVSDGISHLVDQALAAPSHPQRGTVGGLLRLEISVIAVPSDDGTLADLYIVVRTPPLAKNATQPSGWPGTHLLERLAELATGVDAESLTLSAPAELPTSGGTRPVDYSNEMATSSSATSSLTTLDEQRIVGHRSGPTLQLQRGRQNDSSDRPQRNSQQHRPTSPSGLQA